MIKFFVTIFLIFLHIQFSSAQTTFSQDYSYQYRFVQLIDSSADGGYFFCGRSENFDATLGKIDLLGNLLWAKQIGYLSLSETPYDLTVLTNGNVIVAMTIDSGSFSSTQKTSLISFDPAGNHVFTKTFVNASPNIFVNTPLKIINDDTGFTLLVYDGTYTNILKLDSLGNTFKTRSLPGLHTNILKLPSGNYMLCSYYGDDITILSPTLAFQSQTTLAAAFAFHVNGLIRLSSGSFMLYGGDFSSGYVEKFNSQLQFEWANIYDYTFGEFVSGHETANNSVLLLSQCDGVGIPNGCPPLIVQIDTLGNIHHCTYTTTGGVNVSGNSKSKSIYKNGVLTFIYNLLQLPFTPSYAFRISHVDTSFSQLCNVIDSNIVIIDPVFGNIPFTQPVNVVNKNDSLANDTLDILNISFPYGNCNTVSSSDDNLSYQNDINIFPNPVKSTLKITSKDINLITIINILGNIVLKKQYLTGNRDIVELNVSAIIEGIYFIKVDNTVKMFLKQ